MGSISRSKRRRPTIGYGLERCANLYIHFSQSYSELRANSQGAAISDGVFANDFVIEWPSNYHRELANETGIDGQLRSCERNTGI